MREGEFRKFLESSESISSKDKAVRTRVSKAHSIEEMYHISIDTIVSDDNLMYEYLNRINKDFNNKNGGYSNALRKYYQFIYGKTFPVLSQYNRYGTTQKNFINQIIK